MLQEAQPHWSWTSISTEFLWGIHSAGRDAWGRGVWAALHQHGWGSQSRTLQGGDPTLPPSPVLLASVWASSQMGPSPFIQSQAFLLHYHASCCWWNGSFEMRGVFGSEGRRRSDKKTQESLPVFLVVQKAVSQHTDAAGTLSSRSPSHGLSKTLGKDVYFR